MIVTGGENVFSAEVENVLGGCPGVVEAAVIGVPDDKWGERVHAVVVAAAGAGLDAEAIARHCRTRLAGYKVPRSVEFVDALPKTAAGKVAKAALRRPHWAARDRDIG
jgi:acyl-CoA synthetase (AMP-forming)/AMP-acid ligase II